MFFELRLRGAYSSRELCQLSSLMSLSMLLLLYARRNERGRVLRASRALEMAWLSSSLEQSGVAGRIVEMDDALRGRSRSISRRSGVSGKENDGDEERDSDSESMSTLKLLLRIGGDSGRMSQTPLGPDGLPFAKGISMSMVAARLVADFGPTRKIVGARGDSKKSINAGAGVDGDRDEQVEREHVKFRSKRADIYR